MTTTARLIAVLTIVFLGTGVAHADLDQIRRAAEGGDAAAQLELGILFQYGFNYPGNEVPALTWYTLSANQGNAKAAKLRDVLMGKMNAKEVEEAMEQVKSYKPSAAATPIAAPAPETAPAPAPTAPETAAPAAVPAETAPPAPAAPAEAAPATPAPTPAR
jgi:hypothetical protein